MQWGFRRQLFNPLLIVSSDVTIGKQLLLCGMFCSFRLWRDRHRPVNYHKLSVYLTVFSFRSRLPPPPSAGSLFTGSLSPSIGQIRRNGDQPQCRRSIRFYGGCGCCGAVRSIFIRHCFRRPILHPLLPLLIRRKFGESTFFPKLLANLRAVVGAILEIHGYRYMIVRSIRCRYRIHYCQLNLISISMQYRQYSI